MNHARSLIETLLSEDRSGLLEEWSGGQLASPDVRTDLLSANELRVESARFLDALAAAVAADGATADISAPAWADVHEMLGELSRSRAIARVHADRDRDVRPLAQAAALRRLARTHDERATSSATRCGARRELLDRLGLFTTEAYLRSREEVIQRQQDELIELSTPVVKLWEGVVALPLIGTLDSARTQVVMESLLERIVETDSAIAIIDITGVPTVDTLVAQHLLKTVAAARLMGADCIISGIRPQIAQTIVHLGLDLPRSRRRRASPTRSPSRSTAPASRSRAAGPPGPAMSAPGTRIPILKLGHLLLVTIQVDMHDRMAVTLQEDLTGRIVETGARGVLIDISGLELVDSFIGRMLPTSRPWPACSTRPPSSSGCAPRWPSRWSSSGWSCLACEPP